MRQLVTLAGGSLSAGTRLVRAREDSSLGVTLKDTVPHRPSGSSRQREEPYSGTEASIDVKSGRIMIDRLR